MVLGVLHAMNKGTLGSRPKNKVPAHLSNVSLPSDVFWVCNRTPHASHYVRQHGTLEVTFLLLSLRRDLEGDFQVKCSESFPGRVCIDVSLKTGRFFVKRDHIPLSASDNNDTHADIAKSFKRNRSKLRDISLATTTKEMTDEDDDSLLALEEATERYSLPLLVTNLELRDGSNILVRRIQYRTLCRTGRSNVKWLGELRVSDKDIKWAFARERCIEADNKFLVTSMEAKPASEL